ncbi:MAG: RluA family pseudouridine synthase [Bacteroidota bacterium]|jgi:23S rRNA pseudouridine1911/1915/1917 synthase
MLVLFEDNHFIAVNKKPGEIIQGDKTGDEPLSETVKKYLKEKYKKPGEAFVGVAHRLDRPVSGAVVFAKTSKGLARFNELIRDRHVKKTYWAVVKNLPKETQGNLIHYLEKNEQKNKSFAFDKDGKNRLRAELKYHVLVSIENYHLIEIELITGRHHQIRCQFSSIGCPIKGDLKYGFERSNKDGSIHLHARKIEFIHPVKQHPIVITAKVPDETVWAAVMNKLSSLH